MSEQSFIWNTTAVIPKADTVGSILTKKRINCYVSCLSSWYQCGFSPTNKETTLMVSNSCAIISFKHGRNALNVVTIPHSLAIEWQTKDAKITPIVELKKQ